MQLPFQQPLADLFPFNPILSPITVIVIFLIHNNHVQKGCESRLKSLAFKFRNLCFALWKALYFSCTYIRRTPFDLSNADWATQNHRKLILTYPPMSAVFRFCLNVSSRVSDSMPAWLVTEVQTRKLVRASMAWTSIFWYWSTLETQEETTALGTLCSTCNNRST